jgi:hypothetical protein
MKHLGVKLRERTERIGPEIGRGTLAHGMARPGAALPLINRTVTVVSFYSMRRSWPGHSMCQNSSDLAS